MPDLHEIYVAINDVLASSTTRAQLRIDAQGLYADNVEIAKVYVGSGLYFQTSDFQSKKCWPPATLAPAIIDWWLGLETKAMHSANTRSVLTEHFGPQLEVPDEIKVLLAFCERDPLFRELLDRRGVLNAKV